MPCYDPRDDYDLDGKDSTGERWETKAKRLQKKCDKLTRLLCEAMGYQDTRNLNHGSAELREWWREHKRFDEQRGARTATTSEVRKPNPRKQRKANR